MDTRYQRYVSNSGGVDSTVLSDLVHRVYPDVVDVYCDTGLEYPELREFILSKPNVVVLKPQVYNRKTRKYEGITFPQVLERYGYPIVSKEVGVKVSEARSKPNGYAAQSFYPDSPHNIKYNQRFSLVKWKFLLDSDFKVSARCCNVMKKNPAKRFEHESGLHPYIGTMTEESKSRATNWMQFGCNAFNKDRPTSNPLSFWSKSDVLEYISRYKIPYCSVYGDIVEKDGKYTTTGCQRTGCVFCAYGQHLCHPNKFQDLVLTHEKIYDYCMRGGKYDESGNWIPDKGLGMAKVLDYINVKWWNDGDEAKRDKYRQAYQEKENTYESH